MRYKDFTERTYLVRTGTHKDYQALMGKIVLVSYVTELGKIIIYLTEDCRPVGKPIELPKDMDDDLWHDITDLVLEANRAIVPRGEVSRFVSDVAANYRNFINTEGREPLDNGKEIGKVCMLGQTKDGQTVYAKNGYFIVAQDEDGFYLAYQGYCVPRSRSHQMEMQLTVLRIKGTGRKFYDANQIVMECNSAYRADIALANSYENSIKETAASSSTDDNVFSFKTGGISRLNLT